VDAARKVVGLGDARRDELVVHVVRCVAGCGRPVGDEPGLAGHDQLVTTSRTGRDQLCQGPAEHDLAALAAEGDSHVEMVASGRHRSLDGLRIGRVHFVGRIAARHTKAERRDRQPPEGAEMAVERGGRGGSKLPRYKAGGACRGCVPLECHQAVLVVLSLASFFWRSSAFRAIRLKVPERPIAFLTSRIVSPAIAR